ncbi:hypothetical protein MU0083_001669 [[Mycobacterium] kokjensenii]|uniref:Polyketide cyclase n=1 Tax=[Mycobacterium] kokjensenii TaxID=3064287 RepID=A0ABM9LDZ0_9MYCO|nr:hypothetical protein [Mycolicibacter sp. MU0083]CAJ1497428.1 hypothetical protein MU0083_001669 [Mycolicibacter sp. MU0083]
MVTGGESPQYRYQPTTAQWTLAGLIVAFMVGLVLVKLIKGAGLGQTSAFYIGIPTVLAVVLTLSAPSGRAIGMTVKAITILLLLAIPVLGEGFVCVFIAAPLFYAVGILVAWVVQRVRNGGGGVARIAVLPVLALAFSVEGVVPMFTFAGDNTVSASRTLQATPAEVAAALSRPLRFVDVAPTGLLAAGFPRPTSDSGGGLKVGDRRDITFTGAHHRPPVMAAHHWGEASSHLQFEVTRRGENAVRLAAVSDHTPLATWLAWRSADISWRPVDAGHTEVTWSLHYTRRLAPAWYFSPIERVVAGQAAGYLLSTLDLVS